MHRRPRAFTLVEVLVVIGIIALIMAVLIPVAGRAWASADTVKCLSNLRNMQAAHLAYALAHKGRVVQAGLAHGAHGPDESVAWINTLQAYYQDALAHRCPSDASPHWPGGVPVPGGGPGRFRRTSYGINNFLDHELCPWGGPYRRIEQVKRPSSTVHFLEMAGTGPFAGADHPHVENWAGNVPVQAARHVATGAHGGRPASFDAVANYGFLDGHAETLRFSDVFRDFTTNRFDPAVAR